jgi:hypothetical protein
MLIVGSAPAQETMGQALTIQVFAKLALTVLLIPVLRVLAAPHANMAAPHTEVLMVTPMDHLMGRRPVALLFL